MDKTQAPGPERRKYLRLDSVFPVQFRLVNLEGKGFLSDWLQGFTNDVGRGGLCLSVNNLNPEFTKLLKAQQAKVSLDIEMPIIKSPVNALARVAWIKQAAGIHNRSIIGLVYEEIDTLQNNKIMRYAWSRKLFAPVVLGIILVLGVGFAVDSVVNIRLIQGNKAMVAQLVKVVQEASAAKQRIKEISRQREDLQRKMQSLKSRMQTVDEEKAGIEGQVKSEASRGSERIEKLDRLTEQLSEEKKALQEQLLALQNKESIVSEEFLRLDKRKTTLEKESFEKMYQWLKVHQNQRTGLSMSFEGDSDIANWAFVYDQSLLAQSFTNFSDFERARKVFGFFNERAKRSEGQFYNAYYVNDGSPAEYVVHSGPNIWLGIAIMQYTRKSGDHSYVKLAEEIAQAIINLQNQDREGGIRGGPNVSWYSTEHNLDAYAFFNMLYKITGKARYQETAVKVLNWLVQHTYDKFDLPIKRGKGDSTIATDTYAWSIAAIGPEKLEELGMNPERILEFAEQNCAIEVSYIRPEGQSVKIKGFDFAPQRNLARGGVVSSEWTAQMIMAFRIMADFYYKKGMPVKANSYAAKADEYLSGLSNMIISSPSPSGQGEDCLPYATQDFVDTGHGWFTPKGKATGSISGTAYAVFAYYNYNPLGLKD